MESRDAFVGASGVFGRVSAVVSVLICLFSTTVVHPPAYFLFHVVHRTSTSPYPLTYAAVSSVDDTVHMALRCKTARYGDLPRIEIVIRPSSTSLLFPPKRMIIAIGPRFDAALRGYV
jgi:hypothetical protein